MTVAWIGLGAMGAPMAGRLATEHDTLVWNRTASVAAAHEREHESRAVDDLADVGEADVLFSCLPTTAEVADVVDRLVASLAPDTVWVDCTSGDPAPSRTVAATLADGGIDYLDAPVSGGTDGAASGTLTIMVGGDQNVLEQVHPLLELLGDRIVHVGPTGAGHATKAINNMLLAANLWTAVEGLAALVRQGVPGATALEVINGSSGQSFATERIIAERVVTREFPVTFTLGLLAKDAGVAQSVLDDSEIPAPALRALGELIRATRNELGPDVDHSAVAQLVERWADVEIS